MTALSFTPNALSWRLIHPDSRALIVNGDDWEEMGTGVRHECECKEVLRKEHSEPLNCSDSLLESKDSAESSAGLPFSGTLH